MYKLARKHIIISPNKNPSIDYLKSILPIALISGFFAVIVRYIFQINYARTAEKAISQVAEVSVEASEIFVESQSFINKLIGFPFWVWFLMGFLIAVGVVLIINWRKLRC